MKTEDIDHRDGPLNCRGFRAFDPDDSGNRPGILVVDGAQGIGDPAIKHAQLGEFQGEMRQAAADWQVIAYRGTVHSFTNPDAAKAVKLKGAAYTAQTDLRSWAAMCAVFDEIFEAA